MARSCPNGWLKAYREYTAQQESPDTFHLWTALSMLSSTVRRNVWVDQGYYKIFPNLYVILVAPPGVCKKSVAMSIGLKLLRKVGGVNIESNKMSPESLIYTMSGGDFTIKDKKAKGKKGRASSIKVDAAINATTLSPVEKLTEILEELEAATTPATQPVIKMNFECTTTLASTEFSVMLGKDAAQSGLLSLLTDLYDSPDYWSYKTLGRGINELYNVFINIIGATTPEWLGSSIPTDAIGGGFTSRILFVVQGQRRSDNPRPKITDRELALRKFLIDDLNYIATLKGEMQLDEDANVWYDNWYRTRDRNNLDERFWGYLERKPDHLLKVATLIAISVNDDLVISQAHLKAALELLNQLEERMPDAFRGIGTASAKDIERIADQLMHAGGSVPYRELVHRNYRYLSSQDLDLVLQTMNEAGMTTTTILFGTKTVTLNPPKTIVNPSSSSSTP